MELKARAAPILAYCLSKGPTKHLGTLGYNLTVRPVNYGFSLLSSFLHGLVSKAKTTGEKILVSVVIFLILSWSSVLSYASFYSLYLPTAEISRQVHLSFSVCPGGVGICSFPSANISLAENSPIKEVLGSGQMYRVIIDLDIPDTPVNRDLGMFMVVLRMFDRSYHISATSKRTGLFKYKSLPMRLLAVTLLSPLHFLGFSDEKQTVSAEMFSSYVDDFYHPSVGANVEIQNHMIQIYSCQLKFYAKFSGLRYILYTWPITSALCGICFNFTLFTIVFAVAFFNNRDSLRVLTQTLSREESSAEEVAAKQDKKDKKKNTNGNKKKFTQSTQTRANLDDDVETYDLPLVQEPVDFGILGDEDLELMAELRHRRVQ